MPLPKGSISRSGGAGDEAAALANQVPLGGGGGPKVFTPGMPGTEKLFGKGRKPLKDDSPPMDADMAALMEQRRLLNAQVLHRRAELLHDNVAMKTTPTEKMPLRTPELDAAMLAKGAYWNGSNYQMAPSALE